IWDLAPHDLSIVDHILTSEARSISAWGCAHADPAIEDIAYVNVDYGERLPASFHVNWLSPVKVRQMIFAGSRKSLIFNELNTAEPVKIYDRGIELGGTDDRQKLMVGYRSGDVLSPHIEPAESLRGVVTHFAECIRDSRTPLSDGRLGLRVVRLLEAATRSIRAQGGRVVLNSGVHANGSREGDARASRAIQRTPALAGCEVGRERGAALLR
ncbi:MAG: Gfo/Idh/MocA family oxidoreductase, partial [Candidatus Acidiferrum sp.]